MPRKKKEAPQNEDPQNDAPENEEKTTTAPISQSLSHFIRYLVVILLFVAFAATFVLTLRMLCVIFAGFLLGIFLFRLSQILQHHTYLSYKVSFAIIITAISALGIGVGFFIVPQLISQFSQLSSKLVSSLDSVTQQFHEWGIVGKSSDKATEVAGKMLGGIDATAWLGGLFSSLSGIFTIVFIILFIALFFAINPSLYLRGTLLLVPPVHRPRAKDLIHKSIDKLWAWTWGRLISMSIVGLFTAGGLALLGVPLALTLGFLAGILSFVPNIGAVVAIIPALLVALQQGPQMPLYVLALYLGIQLIESNLITPLVQQQAVSVPPVVLLVAQVLMGLLVGIVGVAVATPLVALLILLIRETYVKKMSEEGASYSISSS